MFEGVSCLVVGSLSNAIEKAHSGNVNLLRKSENLHYSVRFDFGQSITLNLSELFNR